MVGLHRRRVLRDKKLLVGDLLQGDQILAPKLLKTLEIGLGLGMKGGVLGQLSLRLRQRRLEETRVDLGEESPFLTVWPSTKSTCSSTPVTWLWIVAVFSA